MPQELTTQQQFDAFADDVARELGTHCRTAPLPEYTRGLARLIVDGEGRGVRLCQPDDEQPDRLKIYPALPDEAQVQTPSIGVTAISARHVAREITRRLYPLHAEAADLAAQLAARQQAEIHLLQLRHPFHPPPPPATHPAPRRCHLRGLHGAPPRNRRRRALQFPAPPSQRRRDVHARPVRGVAVRHGRIRRPPRPHALRQHPREPRRGHGRPRMAAQHRPCRGRPPPRPRGGRR